jgi:hypothetical protein
MDIHESYGYEYNNFLWIISADISMLLKFYEYEFVLGLFLQATCMIAQASTLEANVDYRGLIHRRPSVPLTLNLER